MCLITETKLTITISLTLKVQCFKSHIWSIKNLPASVFLTSACFTGIIYLISHHISICCFIHYWWESWFEYIMQVWMCIIVCLRNVIIYTVHPFFPMELNISQFKFWLEWKILLKHYKNMFFPQNESVLNMFQSIILSEKKELDNYLFYTPHCVLLLQYMKVNIIIYEIHFTTSLHTSINWCA